MNSTRNYRSVLSRFRNDGVTSTLYLLMLCWSLNPPFLAHSAYVPDSTGNNPVWVPLPGDSAIDPNNADMGDADNNGVADWLDHFNYQVGAGYWSYWGGGGPFMVDGVTTTYGGQWHGSALDTDGDGIPDDLDPYPSDPNNNSFFWTGGDYTLNGIRQIFRSGWYAGSVTDTNSNGIPDSLEDWFSNSGSHGTLQYWAGGTVLLNGQYSTYNGVYYYASSVRDSDGDGIPDELDPYPSDPWNNTYFSWPGGDVPVNGSMLVSVTGGSVGC